MDDRVDNNSGVRGGKQFSVDHRRVCEQIGGGSDEKRRFRAAWAVQSDGAGTFHLTPLNANDIGGER